ncbi:hypothetical protein PybrP1_001528 [[Pythium] brassicae (nom. inval.)]|nr:hypothetical protein PybrP1_001528 [[Pythium] brassicae (nom. inval.)]
MLLPERRSPKTLEDWQRVLEVRVVMIPDNGSCFFYALHAIKCRDLRYPNTRISKTHAIEGGFYRREVVASLADAIPIWLSRGFASLPKLGKRYSLGLDGADPEVSLVEVQGFLMASSAQSITQKVGMRYWAGTEEIMAAVWYLQEPLYVMGGAGHESRCLASVAELLRQRGTPATVDPDGADAQFLLFFDGWPRGNPGPGGSGAAITRIHDQQRGADLEWAGCTSSMSEVTTNNATEYAGLTCGLRAAVDWILSPLHVVGDTNHILMQMRGNWPPRSTTSLPLYLTARHLAYKGGVATLTHHYRRHNKMADGLANAANDARGSAQDGWSTFNPLLRASRTRFGAASTRGSTRGVASGSPRATRGRSKGPPCDSS